MKFQIGEIQAKQKAAARAVLKDNTCNDLRLFNATLCYMLLKNYTKWTSIYKWRPVVEDRTTERGKISTKPEVDLSHFH